MKVFDSQSNTTLSSAAPAMKLTDSGSIPASSGSSDYGFREYGVTITVPDASKPFLFCVKSDYDAISTASSNYDTIGSSPSDVDMLFYSDSGTTKYWRLYTSFDYSTYSVSTNYGLILKTGAGTVAYDSRVPEAILVDVLDIPSSDGSVFHNSASPAWYAINLFPGNAEILPVNSQYSAFTTRCMRQKSSTETETLPKFIYKLPSGAQYSSNYGSSMPIVTSLGL